MKIKVKEVVEAYSIALSKGDIPTAFSHFSPDAKWHQPGNNKFSGTKSGLDADTVWYEGVQRQSINIDRKLLSLTVAIINSSTAVL